MVIPGPMGLVHMISDPHEMTKIMRSEGKYPNGAVSGHSRVILFICPSTYFEPPRCPAEQWPIIKWSQEKEKPWAISGTKDK